MAAARGGTLPITGPENLAANITVHALVQSPVKG